MIIALVKVYQSERHGLKKCLDSLQNIDSIILCDGRFPDSAWGTADPKQLEYYHKRYPLGNESTDNSKEIAKEYSNLTWLWPPRDGWQSETDKMNHMLKMVPQDEDSWVLLIDPDERLIGNIRTAIPASRSDIVPMRVVDREGHSLYYHRLFKNKTGISFATHHSLQVNGILELYLGNAPESVYLLHERIEV